MCVDTVSSRSPALRAVVEDEMEEVDEEHSSPNPSGYQVLLDFCERCLPNSTKPSTETGSGDGDVSSDWRKLQGAPTPTLLDNLKFHDLVFGRDLGSGAFSLVRYARKIERGKPRDQWPEYAVKVVSAAKMNEQSYHASGGN
jgi:hypothetical protein